MNILSIAVLVLIVLSYCAFNDEEDGESDVYSPDEPIYEKKRKYLSKEQKLFVRNKNPYE